MHTSNVLVEYVHCAPCFAPGYSGITVLRDAKIAKIMKRILKELNRQRMGQVKYCWWKTRKEKKKKDGTNDQKKAPKPNIIEENCKTGILCTESFLGVAV